MSGNTSIIISLIMTTIALYVVTAASYVIYCAIKANVTHDKCYDSMYKKGQAIGCLCPGKSEPMCTDCPYFTYLQFDTLTKQFVDKAVAEVIRDLDE